MPVNSRSLCSRRNKTPVVTNWSCVLEDAYNMFDKYDRHSHDPPSSIQQLGLSRVCAFPLFVFAMTTTNTVLHV